MRMTDRDFNEKFEITFGGTIKSFMDTVISFISGQYCLDIIVFEKYLAGKDSDYNADNCTYKDAENISLNNFIEMKYGKEAVAMIDYLLKGNFDKSFNTFIKERDEVKQ